MTLALPATDDTRIWDIWLSMYQVPCLTVALELELFESLEAKPDSAEGLAERRHFNLRGLRALLPVLLQQGLLQMHDGCYHLNEHSRTYLLKSSAYYWGPFYSRTARTLASHKLLLESINNEQENKAKNLPVDGWESGHVDMELARQVTAFMNCHSVASAAGMTRSFDFAATKRMLDVGGGSGCFSIALAKARPDVSCTVMELPTICELVRQYVADAGVGSQVDTVVVDMFRQAWPSGYDTHFFSNVFHDWSVETCLALAKQSHAALPTGGRILLHEMLLDDGALTPKPAVLFSLLMAMGTRGQQFTFGQLREILETAGFRNVSCHHTYGYYSIVSGVR